MQKISIFPAFTPFTINDLGWYSQFYSQFEPYADFHGNNLLIWLNQNEDLAVSNLNGNLVFSFTDPFNETGELNFTMLGDTIIDESLITLFEYFQKKSMTPKLVMVPEVVINYLHNKENYIIEEDIDNNDYILELSSIAHLSGKRYRSLREDCNAFIRRNSDNLLIKELDLSNMGMVQHVINQLHTWDNVYSKTQNDIERHEAYALNKILSNYKQLNYKNICIYIDGQLESFVLYHYPPQETYVMPSNIKVSYRYQDLYDFTVFAFSNRIDEPNVKYINFEQDLGLPGLRQYKQSLKPISYLKKYTVSLN